MSTKIPSFNIAMGLAVSAVPVIITAVDGTAAEIARSVTTCGGVAAGVVAGAVIVNRNNFTPLKTMGCVAGTILLGTVFGMVAGYYIAPYEQKTPTPVIDSMNIPVQPDYLNANSENFRFVIT